MSDLGIDSFAPINKIDEYGAESGPGHTMRI